MNTQRTIQLTIPQSDYALLRHLSHDNGWTIVEHEAPEQPAYGTPEEEAAANIR